MRICPCALASLATYGDGSRLLSERRSIRRFPARIDDPQLRTPPPRRPRAMRRTLSAGNLQQKPERHRLVAVAPVRRDVVDVILQPLRCLLGGQHALVDDEAEEDAGQVEEADLQIVKSVDAPAEGL